MRPPQIVSELKNQFEQALIEFLDEYTSPAELYDPIHYLLNAGGKRVRPLLTLLCAQAVSGNITEAQSAALEHAMPAAIAVELIHNFTLVHDDIMDRSELRRGQPTVHVKWSESAAILSGDVIIGLATRALLRSAHHAKQPLAVVDAFSTGIVDVCDGQALDLALMSRRDVTIDDYFDMVAKKTSSLLEMSAVVGALIGGADTVTVDNVRAFARGIGIAFQLQDDLLDLVGTEDFGKQPGGDIVEGKRTWLMLRTEAIVAEALVAGGTGGSSEAGGKSNTYSELIRDFYANDGLPRERVADVMNMMHALGVVDEARALIERTTLDAFAHLHQLPQSPARDMLEELANTLVARRT